MNETLKQVIQAISDQQVALEGKLAQSDPDGLEAQRQLTAIKLATQRVNSLGAVDSPLGKYDCPVCYIKSGTIVHMAPQGSTTRHDWFRCRECGYTEERKQ